MLFSIKMNTRAEMNFSKVPIYIVQVSAVSIINLFNVYSFIVFFCRYFHKPSTCSDYYFLDKFYRALRPSKNWIISS